MSKWFCHFQVPWCPPGDEDASSAFEQGDIKEWNPDVCLCYGAETCWSALCALVKEEILELLFDRNCPNFLERANALQTMADAHWDALPVHFRFEGSLKQSNKVHLNTIYLSAYVSTTYTSLFCSGVFYYVTWQSRILRLSKSRNKCSISLWRLFFFVSNLPIQARDLIGRPLIYSNSSIHRCWPPTDRDCGRDITTGNSETVEKLGLSHHRIEGRQIWQYCI